MDQCDSFLIVSVKCSSPCNLRGVCCQQGNDTAHSEGGVVLFPPGAALWLTLGYIHFLHPDVGAKDLPPQVLGALFKDGLG